MAAMGTHDQIRLALESLAPNKEWALSGNEYSGLTWLDTGSAPTEQQILDNIAAQ